MWRWEGGGEKWHTHDPGAEDRCDRREGMLQLIEEQGMPRGAGKIFLTVNF